MKKTVKIIIGIFCTLAIIIGAFAIFLGCKGFFRYVSTPEIVSIEITDSNPISLKEANREFDEFDDGEKHEESYCHIGDMNIMHEYTVTLSDKSEFTFPSLDPDPFHTIDKAHSVYVDAYIKRSDVEKALKQKKDTVPVYIEAELYKGDYDEPVYVFECESEKQFAQAVVESIKPLFDSPITISGGANYKLEEKKFEITYADGTVKVLSPTEVKKPDEFDLYDCERYTLDGKTMSIYDSYVDKKREITLVFFDEETKIEVVPVDTDKSSFKKLDCTEVSLPDETENGIAHFTVTKNDGTTEDFTYEFTKEDLGTNRYAAFTEGYPIYICINYTRQQNGNGDIVVTLSAHGYGESEQTFVAPHLYDANVPFDFEYAGATVFSILHSLFS